MSPSSGCVSPSEKVKLVIHGSVASLVAQTLSWKDPLEEGMATHSSILAWRIPWIEELSVDRWGYSLWGRKESDITEAT